MLKLNKLATTALSLSIGLTASLSTQAAERNFISIGTGGVTGVYYPAGGAICRMINKDRKVHGIRCSAESTGGSVYNVNTIRQKELEFGIVQSDIQAAAVQGIRMFDGKPYPGLRAVFSLHAEPIHLMARTESGIKTFADLAGKRVNIGNPGSGQRGMMELLMSESGWTKGTFALASELKSSEQAQALCDNKFDAAFWAAGLPNGAAQEATTTCDVTIVPMAGPAIDAVLAKYPAYSKATIPGGMYRGNDVDIPSFGPKGTLVTSVDVPDEVVYQLVKAVFENFDSFKRLHPAFAQLTPQEMIKSSLVAPLHPGAIKYYKEKGWL
ncbi:MAG: TAXI family TRAP transporter solute-binding subunit [Marinomonas sp.]